MTRGIVIAHERGIVTSTSMMVRTAGAEVAAEAARAVPSLGVGLHIDLAEWRYELGHWTAIYTRTDLDDTRAVAAEVRSQLERFRELVGRDPTHLDGHQHVHREEPARSAAVALARDLGVPLRWFEPEVATVGDFYGQTGTGEALHENVTARALTSIVERLEPGTTELMCHPGLSGDSGSAYDVERELELEALCAPVVVDTLRRCDVEVIRFDALRSAHRR